MDLDELHVRKDGMEMNGGLIGGIWMNMVEYGGIWWNGCLRKHTFLVKTGQLLDIFLCKLREFSVASCFKGQPDIRKLMP